MNLAQSSFLPPPAGALAPLVAQILVAEPWTALIAYRPLGRPPHSRNARVFEILRRAGKQGVLVAEIAEQLGTTKKNVAGALANLTEVVVHVGPRGSRTPHRWYAREFAPGRHL